MKLVLVQSLDGILGEVARVIARNSIIMHGGGSFEKVEAGKTTYVSVASPVEANSFFSWRGLVNNEMIKHARKMKFSHIICIDWFGAHAAISLSETLDVPLVSIFTSTEDMRGHSGISELIKACEKELYSHSNRVLALPGVSEHLGEKAEEMEVWKIGEEIEDIDAGMGISTN